MHFFDGLQLSAIEAKGQANLSVGETLTKSRAPHAQENKKWQTMPPEVPACHFMDSKLKQ